MASKPVRLVAANGLPLSGGSRSTALDISFVQVREHEILPDACIIHGEFYEADIDVDAIISYPWLSGQSVGVYPHLCALSILTPSHTLLYGSIRDWEVQKEVLQSADDQHQDIDTTPNR